MASKVLALFAVLLVGGLASLSKDVSLLQKVVNMQAPGAGVQALSSTAAPAAAEADEATDARVQGLSSTAAPAAEADEAPGAKVQGPSRTAGPAPEPNNHDHDHEEAEDGDSHEDHEGEHDEHHGDHMEGIKAMQAALLEITTAIEDVAKEGKEAEVVGHLKFALKKLALASSKETSHGSDEPHEASHEHEHSAEKIKHAQEHLQHAIADLEEHKEGESEAQHANHTTHATKELMGIKEAVTHAISDGLRACAVGEVEHALRDLLKGMVAVGGPKPTEAAALIQHAIKDLEHATGDLKGLPGDQHKFEQDSHALEDIDHAVSDLKHALEDLADHDGHVGADDDTEHVLEDLRCAMKDIKNAKEDLHTAHALSDLHCALHDLGHIAEHKDDKKEMAHVAECIAHDIVHAAESAVKSKHLSKTYGARLVKAATKMKKKPLSDKAAEFAKKYIDKYVLKIQEKCEAHHKKAVKAKCYQECREAHGKCVSTAECKTLADFAKNEKACWAVIRECTPKTKKCKAACKAQKHTKHDEHEKQAEEDSVVNKTKLTSA